MSLDKCSGFIARGNIGKVTHNKKVNLLLQSQKPENQHGKKKSILVLYIMSETHHGSPNQSGHD